MFFVTMEVLFAMGAVLRTHWQPLGSSKDMPFYIPRNDPQYPQPPEITDPPPGQSAPWEPGEETENDNSTPPRYSDSKKEVSGQPDWLKRAKDAFGFSTTYIDSNYRKAWDDSIRAFNNMHCADSKYNTELYRKRSNLYRPKTRAIIRKNEAAAASAYFSNIELISVSPRNEAIPEERAAAEVMQQILQYRLEESIPWFMVMMGAIQDSQVQGCCVAHIHWRFCEKTDKDGMTIEKEDRPCVDLFPAENLRIDPNANWMDPINTSPYLIHLIPMYWCDVKDKMMYSDPKGRRWKRIPASLAFSRKNTADDSTRRARYGYQQDPADQQRPISDYEIVWIHRHIHKWNGEDWEFYTINSEYMLTEPAPLRESVWHGERPYVMGRAILETHKVMPSSIPTLVKGLQEEANEVSNQRIDNVKFVLNKSYLVRRGKNVDISSLVRNTPGRITLVDDIKNDVQEMSWQDVTQSAYLEQDRLDSDFNDLAGNFSPMQVQTQRTPRESTHTMKMLQAPANLMTEYMLKCHTETFAQPVLRQLMLLEQHYETDATLMALAGQKAKIAQRYGVSEVTDEMMDRHLTLSVNVGMGATDPVMKLQRFIFAINSYAQLSKMPPPGIDLKSVWKEMAGLSGYQDGQRFLIDGVDPQVAKLMQTNMQLQKMLQQMQMQIKNKEGANLAKIQHGKESNMTKEKIAKSNNITKLLTERMRHGGGAQEKIAEHMMDLGKYRLERQAKLEDMKMARDSHVMDLTQKAQDIDYDQSSNEMDLQYQDAQHQMKLAHAEEIHRAKMKRAKKK